MAPIACFWRLQSKYVS